MSRAQAAKQRLKDEVHDMKVLTEYRAWLLRVVGDYQNEVLEEVAHNCTSERGTTVLRARLRDVGLQFDQHLLTWDFSEVAVTVCGFHNTPLVNQHLGVREVLVSMRVRPNE